VTFQLYLYQPVLAVGDVGGCPAADFGLDTGDPHVHATPCGRAERRDDQVHHQDSLMYSVAPSCDRKPVFEVTES